MTGPGMTEVTLPRALPWQSQRIGIAMSDHVIVATEISGGEPCWTLEGPGLEVEPDVGHALRALLARMPRRRGSRRAPMVVVGLPSSIVQCKRLFGFPSVPDPRVAQQVLREGLSRFFRRTADDLVTSQIETDGTETRIAAAYPAAALEALRDAARESRVRLVAVMPRRTPDDDGEVSPSADAMRMAEVAAGLRPARLDGLASIRMPHALGASSRRLTLGVVTIALGLALVAPIVGAGFIRQSASAELATLRQREASALDVARELERTTQALRSIAEFPGDSPSGLRLLAELAAALPPGAAITHLQLDSAGGTIVALTPSADALASGLSRTSMFVEPEIFGPVTRERAGALDLERVSLRFRRVGPPRSPTGEAAP